MANPNIWAPGTAVNADSSVKTQAFIATANQTVFTLTEFSYYRETGSLYVFVAGLFQRIGLDFTETSQTSFTLTEGVPEGTVVAAVGFTEVTGGYEYVVEAEAAAAAAAQSVIDAAAQVTLASGFASDASNSASASAASAVESENYSIQSQSSADASALSAASAASYASVGFDVASAIYDFGFISDASLTFTTDYGSVA
jgi:hypothetical protein